MHDTSTRSPTLTRLDARADRLDRADGLVAEDPAVGHRGHVALEDVQVGAADGRRRRRGRSRRCRPGASGSRSSQAFWPGPWYTSAFMASLLSLVSER